MDQEILFADVRGFMKSRVILTAAELDFFTLLHRGPSTARDLAKRLHLDERGTTRVLDSLISFGLVMKEADHYRTTTTGALLSSEHPETILPVILHMNNLWDRWGDLTAILRKDSTKSGKQGLSFTDRDWKAFIGAMHVIARKLSGEIADFYNTERFTCLLDLGGASGTYAVAFLKKNPALKAILFDLAEVIPMAEERIAAEGLSERVRCVGGDFYDDELPQGADIVLLSAIIHQNSMKENISLYKKIYKALPPGGVLLIRDHIMDESRTRPSSGALFAINMLVNTQGGDTYTFGEVRKDLEEAGFSEILLLRSGDRMDCLVEARKG